jgi:hypothetical protein
LSVIIDLISVQDPKYITINPTKRDMAVLSKTVSVSRVAGMYLLQNQYWVSGPPTRLYIWASRGRRETRSNHS